VGALTRVAYSVTYLAVALVFGFMAVAVWWVFDAWLPFGPFEPFSGHWWLIHLIAALLIGLALFPLYRRLIRFYSE
jgi:hypothetical protein